MNLLHLWIQTDKQTYELNCNLTNCILVIANYCSTANAPTVQNGSVSTYSIIVGGVINFTCNIGYTGSAVATCLAATASAGKWSSVNGSCAGLLKWFYFRNYSLEFCNRFLRILQNMYSCVIAINNYCPTSLPNAPSFSTAPTSFSTIFGTLVVYSCFFGYSGAPSTICTSYNATSGFGSAIIIIALVCGSTTDNFFVYYKFN